MTIIRRRTVPDPALISHVLPLLGALLVTPLLIYPRQLGFAALDLSPAFALLEWGFYIGMFTLAGARLSPASRVISAGLTVICRIVLGAALGLLVSWGYAKPWATSVTQMIWSFPPALIIHVLFMPIALRPLWERLLGDQPVTGRRTRTADFKESSRLRSQPASRTYGSRRAVTATSIENATDRTMVGARSGSLVLESSQSGEATLDQVVSYVGEYNGVQMCWIVDGEGLPLAVWQSSQFTGDVEYWAPISVEAAEFHRRRLSVDGPCRPERIDIRSDQNRVIAEAVGPFWLGVLTDRETDDLISVRLHRARDMITNYLQQSGRRSIGTGEAHYV